ncbi:MAG: asparagine synthase (glutamine-hydrolyzing) [Pseudomonadota bacterium]
MCGLTGFVFRPGALGPEAAEALARAMADTLSHRGPDSGGAWADADAGIALGHRRLAIVDLSPAGHQPMASPSGRYVIAYNGEIYDHADLRARLESEGAAPQWRGTSDTETLVAAFDAWGLEGAIARATGMFALAAWDRKTRALTLTRDRLGEKPLYYGWLGSGPGAAFAFGSELRALRAHPAFDQPLKREELTHFARHGYVRMGHSIHTGVHQLLPGEMLTLAHGANEPELRMYWDGARIAAEAHASDVTEPEAVARLETLLDTAVRRQMIADVPLGAFLSGGIDSSLTVALMQRRSARPVHTFSIGFHEKRYDEANHARALADHLGTDHTELYVGDRELLDVVPKLPDIFDEPFGDASQIPTLLVSRLARESVTVALSGDGGDELFAGYDRYQKGTRLWRRMSIAPPGVRALVGHGLQGVPTAVLDRALAPIRKTPQGKEPNGQWAHRMADYLAAADLDTLHLRLLAETRRAEALAPEGRTTAYALAGDPPPRGALGPTERMMQLDMLTYMPGDILTKVDRAAMAVSLETRAPLLDHKVAEFAWTLPMSMKLGPLGQKHILRRLLYTLVPQRLVDRPKMGFEVPIGLWLRGPLRDWAAALLDPARLHTADTFRPEAVTRMWQEHLAGRYNHGLGLWHVLMLEAWRDRWT